MEKMMSGDPIVVGYDGSAGGDRALRWAFAEGRLRSLPVHVVHIIEWPVTVMPGDIGWLTGEQRSAAKADIEQAVAAVGGSAESTSVVEGSIVGTLCRLSGEASLLVLGARGLGGFSGLLLGSVSVSVAVHATCPVIVVRGEEHAETGGLPVMVGVDDSDQARLAVRFAFEEAAARGCGLVAVRAWHPGADPTGELDTAERHALRAALQEARETFPGVGVSIRLVVGGAGKVLVEASEQAQLMVVGSRGVGGFKGLLMGSIGLPLLHHAHCPVAVVR